MAGLQVSRSLLDMKSAEAVLAVRSAFEKVETLKGYLATLPDDAVGGDPLTVSTGGFVYTADEAYVLRYVFESLNNLNVQPILDVGRKLTGLE